MTTGDLDAICNELPGQDTISVAMSDFYALAASFTTDQNGRTIYQARVGLGITRPAQIIIDPTTAVGTPEGG